MGVYIIAEAGVNHNGDIHLAKRLIEAAKYAGADAVKFQTFKTEKIIGKFAQKAEYQVENTGSAESQYDMVKKLELTYDQFTELRDYCIQKEITFISTPDETDSLDYLADIGVPLIKIGSTEVTNLKFLKEIARKKLPIILSTGMSTLGEVELAINTIYSEGNREVTLMHATTDYPTMAEDVNLKAMITMKDAFKVPVGYSDHTLGNEAAVAAVALGAVVIEKHFTLDKNMEGPDHAASMTPEELKSFVYAIRTTEKLLGDGIKKPTKKEERTIEAARRSIVASRDLEAGMVLTENMIEFKRPGTGLKPEFIKFVLGRKLKNSLKEDQLITLDDI
ncbi:N-acetylneuraminate synthase [Clostridium folliculivorans]|uniref:N-acetylneuraminate synthase n=1 Tax=Clostridium folliculivorans TaxID=2886038 RepID=A0A9W5Y574_9CLOT|nr:N-acetylneuraminate synthase [Clostridium folliculivorans]GKU26934.1 N-acetylneuraminate synthase [Clostridium folliculivorans]GKU31585.1 N-acetylneuraminate synthase [Clostridium folliculivorans]